MYTALEQRVLQCIASKHEEEAWDFKKSWHTKKCDLLHDIICMSNLLVEDDGLIIIGCDEEHDYQLCDVSGNSDRKNTAELVVFLRDKQFAAGMRPFAWVHTMSVDRITFDVIVVKNTRNTPFYLAEKFEGVRAHHIYTRVMDTNTPIDKSADPDRIEKLWRKRFALDSTALEKLHVYLRHPEDWESVDGEMSYFYKYSPEFTIETESDDRNAYEYYLFSQMDSTPHWYKVRIKYHQTILYDTLGIALDGGRLFTSCPNIESFRTGAHQSQIYRAYTRGTIQYALHEFFYYHEHSDEADHARRRYLECIPLFDSEKEKNDFHTYAALHFSTAELPPACFVPSISSRHTQGMNFQVFEDEYKDALRIQVLLTRFRQEDCRN